MLFSTKKGEYSSIGKATVCGTVDSLFKSGYSPYNNFYKQWFISFTL